MALVSDFPDRPGAATTARLKVEIHAQLDQVVPDAPRFALLDFPDHDNVGDSAIWVGELAYLDRRGLRPCYVSQYDAFDQVRLRTLVGDGPILMHGGGNFGDLWASHQPFRESILERFPGRPIIQLPQSIHYEDIEKADRTARLIERHGAFTLFVRDEDSFAFATSKFACETILCPDMAFCMDTPLPRPSPQHDLLLHLRTDKESRSGCDWMHLPSGPSVVRSDWPAEPTSFKRRIQIRSMIDGTMRGRGLKRDHVIEHSYRWRAQARFDRGADLLSSARQVLTDRLHGHIISLILGVPHLVLDNSYGKNSRFISTWNTCDGRNARLIENPSEASDWLERTGQG